MANIEIDKDTLRELASNPENGIKEICEELGMSDPTFYQHLARDPELARRRDGRPVSDVVPRLDCATLDEPIEY